MTVMRAKMRLTQVSGSGQVEVLHFSAVARNDGYPADGSDENNSFAKWTPSADLTMTINNPALVGKFQPGQTFYVDFTEAPE